MRRVNAHAVIQALGLPEGSRVDQRVPKKLLLENGAPTSGDKRLLTDSIEEIQWAAAIKPNTIGVPVYRDAQREYLEIAVLTVTLRNVGKPASVTRMAELVHRAVPYPVLLLQIEEQALSLSLAHKRWAGNEAGKVVLDGNLVSTQLSNSTETDPVARCEIERLFLESLSITCLPQATLHTLYQGWMDCLQALQAARVTGSYRTSITPEQFAARRQALVECERLEAQINGLRAQALRETQMARQVELNLTLKRVEAELATARQKL